jgi:hypothetical protein
LEAIAAGAFPLLPARLSYPELIPAALHTACLYADEEQLRHKTVQFLTTPQSTTQPILQALRQHTFATYGWAIAAQQMDRWLSTVAARQKRDSGPISE